MEIDSYYSTSDTIRKEFLRKKKNIRESKSERMLAGEKVEQLESKLFGPDKLIMRSVDSYSSLVVDKKLEPLESIRYALREVSLPSLNHFQEYRAKRRR